MAVQAKNASSSPAMERARNGARNPILMRAWASDVDFARQVSAHARPFVKRHRKTAVGVLGLVRGDEVVGRCRERELSVQISDERLLRNEIQVEFRPSMVTWPA